jgi:hypothetical protein
MSGKNLRQAAATLVKQLQARVQPLIADVTSLEVWTYGVDALLLESVAASEDVATLAQQHGYTRITFHCDLNACTETGREEAVDADVRPMHNSMLELSLEERETLLAAGRETLGKLRR